MKTACDLLCGTRIFRQAPNTFSRKPLRQTACLRAQPTGHNSWHRSHSRAVCSTRVPQVCKDLCDASVVPVLIRADCVNRNKPLLCLHRLPAQQGQKPLQPGNNGTQMTICKAMTQMTMILLPTFSCTPRGQHHQRRHASCCFKLLQTGEHRENRACER